jgi:hypothetical protein
MDYLVAQMLDASKGVSLPLPFSAGLLTILKWTMGTISILLFVLICIVAWKLRKLWPGPSPFERVSESIRAAPVAPNRMSRQWEKIKARLEEPSEAEWKIAIIEADKLVDDVLRRMGYPGTSMGERLKMITPAQLQTIEALWAAHKVRNAIVHDPDARLLYRDARAAIENFEAFLKEAQILS